MLCMTRMSPHVLTYYVVFTCILELEGRYSAQQIQALVPLFVDQSHPSIKHDGVTSEIQWKSSFVGIWAF